MTDTPPEAETLRPATPVRTSTARARRAGMSLIWIVPILALIVTLGLAWNAFAGRGTLVQVSFRDATGITPGETLLKFREIAVGKVEAVRFTSDLQRVVVDIRVDKDVAPYIDDNAQFWIVRPQVSTQGISRLDTVLTGVFIEGTWSAAPGPRNDEIHQGLDRPPLTRASEKGTWITLSSTDAKGMAEGAPIFYRGLTVGRMQNLHLSDKDESVLADAFIEAPHDRRLTTQTVFWNISGFSVSFGTQGLSLNVNSLASLLQGGAEFSTLSSGGQPVQPGQVFKLQPDESTARALGVAEDPDAELRLTMQIPEAVKGLTEGAEVQFRGLTVGRVTNLAVKALPAHDGRPGTVMQDITFAVTPQRLGLPPEAGRQEALTFLQDSVKAGLRARLSAAGFLGTSLMVELVEVPNSGTAEIDTTAQPFPIIPSAPANLSDFTANAQGLMTRIGKLPLEETLKAATDMMNSVTTLANSQDTQAIPGGVRKTVDEAQATMETLRKAADDIGAVAAQIKDQETATKLTSALDNASQAAQSIRDAAVTAPETMDRLNKAADSVAKVNFEGIGNQVQGIIGDVRAMIGTQDAKELPRNLSDTLKAAAGLLNDLRDGNAAGSLNAMLASARVAADNVANAAQSFPTLSARYQQLAARAEGVVAAYGERGAFNNEAVNTMRALRRASDAFGSLATTIERNPRAFILGR